MTFLDGGQPFRFAFSPDLRMSPAEGKKPPRSSPDKALLRQSPVHERLLLFFPPTKLAHLPFLHLSPFIRFYSSLVRTA
jgi:hypothetical protein